MNHEEKLPLLFQIAAKRADSLEKTVERLCRTVGIRLSRIAEAFQKTTQPETASPSHTPAAAAGSREQREDTSRQPANPGYVPQLGQLAALLEKTVRSTQPVLWTDAPGKDRRFLAGLQPGKTAAVPAIPLLARGAVLPANPAFQMAAASDTPVADQDALSRSLEDYSEGNMAGHEATIGILRQILAAISDISLGDEVITGAVLRRKEKLSVVKGGLW